MVALRLRRNLAALVLAEEPVAAGEEIVIARAGGPVARLVRLDRPVAGSRRDLGMQAGRLRTADDFGAPLPDDVLASFEDGSAGEQDRDGHPGAAAAGHPPAALGARRSGRIDRATRAVIEDTGSELLFSAASIWEIAIRTALGRTEFRIGPARLYTPIPMLPPYSEPVTMGSG